MDEMPFSLQALGRIKKMQKQFDLPADDVLQLQTEIAAAAFILEATDEERRRMNDPLIGASASVVMAQTVAVGAVVRLENLGVNKDNARQYIEEKLRDLEEALGNRGRGRKK